MGRDRPPLSRRGFVSIAHAMRSERSDVKAMETSMSTQENAQIVKDAFAAVGRGDKQGLLALSAEDVEWIIPGEEWPLAGTHRGHAGLADLVQKASEIFETSFPEAPEFVAEGDRVLVVGVSRGSVKATKKTFEDHFVFAITVRDGKLTNIREYIDTEALARAVSPGPLPIDADTTRNDS
jgi:ketosteroid isomerase-like protein